MLNAERSDGVENVDGVLLERCAAGDAQALEQLYRQYHRRVFNLVFRMVGPQEAEELTQDAFVRVFRGLKRFRGEAQLGTWIYRVAMNTCLTHLSRRSRRAKLDDQYREAHRMPERLGNEQRSSNPMLKRQLESALKQLPPGYRAVLVLHDIEGLNHQEISKILSCREGTSKSQLHKARMRMREILQPAITAEAV